MAKNVVSAEALRQVLINIGELFVRKDGEKVLSTNDFTNELKAKLEGLEGFTLSPATAAALGGIIVGSGLTVENDGTLNLDTLTINDITDLATTLASKAAAADVTALNNQVNNQTTGLSQRVLQTVYAADMATKADAADLTTLSNKVNNVSTGLDTKVGASTLFDNGVIRSDLLPSFVDDVVEGYYDFSAGKFYSAPKALTTVLSFTVPTMEDNDGYRATIDLAGLTEAELEAIQDLYDNDYALYLNDAEHPTSIAHDLIDDKDYVGNMDENGPIDTEAAYYALSFGEGNDAVDAVSILSSEDWSGDTLDVKRYEYNAANEITGETDKIYLDLTTNCSYRFGGSAYVLITSADISLMSAEETNTVFNDVFSTNLSGTSGATGGSGGSCLPTYSASNNGQVLGISNGSPTWVDVPSGGSDEPTAETILTLTVPQMTSSDGLYGFLINYSDLTTEEKAIFDELFSTDYTLFFDSDAMPLDRIVGEGQVVYGYNADPADGSQVDPNLPERAVGFINMPDHGVHLLSCSSDTDITGDTISLIGYKTPEEVESVPSHTISDAGKVLGVNINNQLAWVNEQDELLIETLLTFTVPAMESTEGGYNAEIDPTDLTQEELAIIDNLIDGDYTLFWNNQNVPLDKWTQSGDTYYSYNMTRGGTGKVDDSKPLYVIVFDIASSALNKVSIACDTDISGETVNIVGYETPETDTNHVFYINADLSLATMQISNEDKTYDELIDAIAANDYCVLRLSFTNSDGHVRRLTLPLCAQNTQTGGALYFETLMVADLGEGEAPYLFEVAFRSDDTISIDFAHKLTSTAIST